MSSDHYGESADIYILAEGGVYLSHGLIRLREHARHYLSVNTQWGDQQIREIQANPP